MKGQNYFAKGNQGIMDIQDKLDKIKSRQLGRLVGELKKINTSQIVIDGVEKYFNYSPISYQQGVQNTMKFYSQQG